MGHSGRRPGASGTREEIRAAAARLFAEQGYDRTSLRAIARAAGVDQKLVAHFFGSKQRLFVEVVELPFDPSAVLPALLGGDRDGVGERFARFVLGVLEDPDGRRRLTGLVRAAATEPDAARMVRELITREVFVHIVEALGVEDGALRASLLGSQIVGLVMARYVVAVEPLASASPEAVVAAIAPNLQRYLVEPLPPAATARDGGPAARNRRS
ncbi:MAG: TetR family transcriptional regulator [Actinomycetota bacterium]|nr:TetR family transcriptional regulator [Actinomycetota bacterium]